MESFADRLKHVMTEKRLDNGTVAEAARVDPVTVSQWRRGRQAPSDEKLAALANYLGVSAGWLRFGETAAEPVPAPMQVEAGTGTPAGISRELSPPARKFLYAFLAELAEAEAPERLIGYARSILTRPDNYTYAFDGTKKPMTDAEELVEMGGLAEGLRIILRHKGVKIPKHRA